MLFSTVERAASCYLFQGTLLAKLLHFPGALT